MTTTADKLREAKALIEDPERWCQGTYSIDADGRRVDSPKYDGIAVAWCVEGALFKVGGDVISGNINDLMIKAAESLGFRDQVQLNDQSDHPTVMKMFDRAIELAEREELGDG